jgi:hypothetical protein
VRRRKGSIRARVKADLPIAFTDEKLSAYGGLELFRRFLDRSGFAERLKEVFSLRQFDGDYGSFRVTLALIGMLLLGGTRLRHLRVLERDPLFLRFARLQRLPTDRTVSNTLKETTRPVCQVTSSFTTLGDTYLYDPPVELLVGPGLLACPAWGAFTTATRGPRLPDDPILSLLRSNGCGDE